MRTNAILLSLLIACGGNKPTTTVGTPTIDNHGEKTYDYSEDAVSATAKDEPAPPPNPTPSPSHSLGKESIRATIHSALGKLAACAANSAATVTVTVAFVIDAKGAVMSSKATGADDATDACIGDLVKGLMFDAGGGVTNVTYPIKIAK